MLTFSGTEPHHFFVSIAFVDGAPHPTFRAALAELVEALEARFDNGEAVSHAELESMFVYYVEAGTAVPMRVRDAITLGYDIGVMESGAYQAKVPDARGGLATVMAAYRNAQEEYYGALRQRSAYTIL